MKNKKTLLVLMTWVLTSVSYGQLKIDASGRSIVGPNSNMGSFDLGNVVSMAIQGKIGDLHAGSKLAFGDFGQYENVGWNVFIGEYGSTDSDIMWIHGKNGVRLTSYNGSYVLAEFGCDGTTRSVFRQGIRADRLSISSNDSYKSNFAPIHSALPKLLQLNSVSYRYTLPREYTMTDEGISTLESESRNDSNMAQNATGKERDDYLRMTRLDSIRSAGSVNYGFVTEDLERMFPNLVETDARGEKYVDYIGLIPVIIAAINEQQQTIDMLNAQLADCCKGGNADESASSGTKSCKPNDNQTVADGDMAKLFQNTPNPFSLATTIQYHVPTSVSNAMIYIFNLNGLLVRSIPIDAFGDGSITIDGSTLAAGMYVYSLVVDGVVSDSKRMILTQ